jgi:hypothetical protein
VKLFGEFLFLRRRLFECPVPVLVLQAQGVAIRPYFPLGEGLEVEAVVLLKDIALARLDVLLDERRALRETRGHPVRAVG